MAELSKTAKKSKGEIIKKRHYCTKCKTGERQVVKFTGYGPRGFFWVCVGLEGKQAPCGFQERTR